MAGAVTGVVDIKRLIFQSKYYSSGLIYRLIGKRVFLASSQINLIRSSIVEIESFFLIGGVDKREIAKGKNQIDLEMKKLSKVIENGGYIPTIDHAIPPDISLGNFKYYLEVKKRYLG